jgi:hypothetical protein
MTDNPTIPDETLMAYVDGELPADEAARVAARLETDAEARARADLFVQSKALVGGAFAKLLSEPVPERLLAAAAGPTVSRAPAREGTAAPPADVVPFKPKAAPMARPAVRVWPTAMAASIAALVAGGLGYLVGQSSIAPVAPAPSAFNLAAPSVLAAVAATPDGDSRDVERLTVTVTGTYRMNDGRICRTVDASHQTAPQRALALACQQGTAWQLTASFPIPTSDAGAIRPASASNALDAVLDAGGAGEALNRSDVNALISRGWQP